MCVMKSATIREVQHNFSKLLQVIGRGEEIHVFRRKIPVARILPFQSHAPVDQPVDWSDLPARLRVLWKDGPPGGTPSHVILDDLRGDR